ncbi:MAG: hypothetical protein SVY10_09840 [Thermodesulfobacteriota bacterium]|nr:hypothetical protein [Thermodesulfobacteriota bacterium]
MVKRLLTVVLISLFFFGCATLKGTTVKAPPKELTITLKSVEVKMGAEKILSDKILMAKKLAKGESKSGWLKLLGMGKDKKIGPVDVPANALLALVPKADLTVIFEATNPNQCDLVIGSMAFGLSEETIIFFPAKSKTAEVWVDVFAGETVEFEVPMTLLKIPSLAAIAWPAIESGSAEWKARGTAVVIGEEMPSGGMRQRFETAKVGTTMVKDEKK